MSRELLVKLLADRVKLYGWTIEMIPEAFRAEVEAVLNG